MNRIKADNTTESRRQDGGALGMPATSLVPTGDLDGRYLIIEENRSDQVLLRVFFRRCNIRDEQLVFVTSPDKVPLDQYRLVLCDLNNKGTGDLHALKKVRRLLPDCPVVVLTAHSNPGLGVEAIRAGAQDFLVKGNFRDNEFAKTIRFAVERHFMQKQLQLSREQYIELFDTNPQPSCVYEMDTLRIVKVNRRFCEVYGYSVEEALKLTAMDIRSPEDQDRLAEDMSRLKTSGLIDLSAIRHRKSNGETITVEVSSQRLRHNGTELVIATMNDISSKVAYERNLILRNERFEQASKATRDVIYDWDLLTNQIFWGESFNIQFGYYPEPGKFNIQKWSSCVHPDDRPDFVRLLDELISGYNPLPTWEREYRMKRKDGTYSFVKDRALIIRTGEGKGLRIIGALEDITDRKNAELQMEDAFTQLQKFNSKYEDLFTEAPAFICYLKGPDHVYQLVNPEYQRLIGGRETIGLPVRKVLPELVAQGFIEKLDHVFRSGNPVSGKEVPVVFEDRNSGKEREAFVNFVYTPSRDSSGNIDGIYVFGVDVTDLVLSRKRVEEASKERKDILESITDVFFALDRNTVLTYWNRAAEKKFSLSKKEAVGHHLSDVITGSDESGFIEKLEAAIPSDKAIFFELHCERLNRWFDVSVYPKKDGLSVYMKDITSEKAFEVQMQEIQDNLEALINSTDDMIWSVSRDGKLISANRPFIDKMRELSGVEIHEGDSILIPQLDPHILSKWKSHYDRAFKGERFTVAQKQPTSRGVRHCIFTFNPIPDESGGVSGVACYSRDVTERTNHLQAIQKQHRRFKEIAWLQSHVIRAPLARIMGLCSLIAEGDGEDKSRDELLGYIMDSARELDSVITDISKKTEAIYIQNTQRKEPLNES